MSMLLMEDENIISNDKGKTTIKLTVSSERSRQETVEYYLRLLYQYLRPESQAMKTCTPKNLASLGEILRALKAEFKSGTDFVDIFLKESNKGMAVIIELLSMLHFEMDKLGRANAGISVEDAQHSIKKRLTEEYLLLLCIRLMLDHSVAERGFQQLMKAKPQSKVTAIARCLISRFSKSRLISLQILTRICEVVSHGHHVVLKSMTSLRFQLSEAVRFKFLVNLLNSTQGSSAGFQIACLKFINTLLDKTIKASYRVQLQSELIEAGFKVQTIEEKICLKDLDGCREILDQIDRWHNNFIDVDALLTKYKELETQSSQLKTEAEAFRKNIVKLEEDKINLMQIEKELAQKCEDKENEFHELQEKFKKLEAEKISAPSTVSSPQETDDSGWRSCCSPEFESPEEMASPDNEEVTISAPVLLKPDPENQDDPEEYVVPVKSEYFLFSNRQKIGSRSLGSTTKAQYHGSYDSLTSNINGKRFEDDFDSALSETDSDSKPSSWKYPSIPSPIFRCEEHHRKSNTNFRMYKPSEKSFSNCRSKNEDALIEPLLKNRLASYAEPPSVVFQNIHPTNPTDQPRRSFVTRSSNHSKTFRVYPTSKRISASLVEISPMPVPIPTPDYPNETADEDSPVSSMSLFRKTSVKFRKAFSERKKKQKPHVWEVI